MERRKRKAYKNSETHCRKGHPREGNFWIRPNGDIRCKECERISKRYFRYGLTDEQFEDMFNAQGRCCAICRIGHTDGRDWCVEHSHRTKKIRGITCHACNRALGNVNDSLEILQALIEYLKRTEYGDEHSEDFRHDESGKEDDVQSKFCDRKLP